MANISDIRNGLTFRYNHDIYSVIGFQHVKMGRGSRFCPGQDEKPHNG